MAEAGSAVQQEPRFGYFVLHARCTSGTGEARLALVLEDLGTGEKHRFESAEGLTAFLDRWGRVPLSASSP